LPPKSMLMRAAEVRPGAAGNARRVSRRRVKQLVPVKDINVLKLLILRQEAVKRSHVRKTRAVE
jgi:hypothetical protein